MLGNNKGGPRLCLLQVKTCSSSNMSELNSLTFFPIVLLSKDENLGKPFASVSSPISNFNLLSKSGTLACFLLKIKEKRE